MLCKIDGHNINNLLARPELLDEMNFSGLSWDGELLFKKETFGLISLGELVRGVEAAYIHCLNSAQQQNREALDKLAGKILDLSKEYQHLSYLQKAFLSITRSANNILGRIKGATTEERITHISMLVNNKNDDKILCDTKVNTTLSPRLREPIPIIYSPKA